MDNSIPFATILDSLKSDPKLKIPYLYRLSDMGEEDWRSFQAQWASFSDERRRVIARHLADLTEENSLVNFESVFGLLLQDPLSLVRLVALDGLWDSQNPRYLPLVIEKMEQDGEGEVRNEAARVLGNYSYQSYCGLMPSDVAEVVVPALLRQLHNPQTPPTLYRTALQSVSYANIPEVTRLIQEAYRQDDTALRLSAVEAMGINADERWLVGVIKEMNSPYLEMRQTAIRAAGNIGSEQALPALSKIITNADNEFEVRVLALESVASLEGERGEQFLNDLVTDTNFIELRETILEILDEAGWGHRLDHYPLLNWDEEEEEEDEEDWEDEWDLDDEAEDNEDEDEE